MRAMILGMSTATFTVIHVILSLERFPKRQNRGIPMGWRM
jgi:hypothetical protein